MDNAQEQRDIIFDDEEFTRPSRATKQQTSALAQWVITYSGGYVTEERYANYVLIGLILVAFSAIGMIGMSLVDTTQVLTQPQQEQLDRMERILHTQDPGRP